MFQVLVNALVAVQFAIFGDSEIGPEERRFRKVPLF